MKTATIRNLFAAIILAGLFAINIGAAFADSHPMTLHQAALDGNTAEVNRLIDGGADVNAKDNNGTTPLHWAIWNGHTEARLALIKAGADINAKNNNGWTPLHFAAATGQTETMLSLIKAGAAIDAKNKDGETPLDYVIRKHGEDSEIERILARNLHQAAKDGNTAEVQRLIDGGVNANSKNPKDQTPLHFAAGEGHTETMHALIKAGAAINAKTNNNGTTPLHWATWNGHTKAMLALVKAGADLFASMDDEKTALDIAIEKHGEDSTAAIFLQGAMEKQREKERQKAEEQRDKKRKKAEELLRELD